MIEFVVASHSDKILKENIMLSEAYGRFVFNIKRGYSNIPQAYNSAEVRADNIIVYAHHDVFLPASFERDLLRSIERLPDDWAVAGVAGVKLVNGKKEIHGYISDRGRKWGSPWLLPAEVDTLDELLLITRGDLRFDEQFDLHFYGADICMQARLQGKKCYAINAYCEHNSGLPVGHRSQSFKDCQEKFKTKYSKHLPILTTCSLVS